MSSPYYQAISGKFTLIGKDPDGDSVRFIPDDLALLQEIKRGYLIKPSKDGSVQLRLEGIDAPETHYGSAMQRLGVEAKNQLLKFIGFSSVTYEKGSTRVKSSKPLSLPAVILTQASDPHGRPISFAFAKPKNGQFQIGEWNYLSLELLQKSLNHEMLKTGLAYYLAYNSLPKSVQNEFRRVAMETRDARKGVWQIDSTPEFRLANLDSIGPKGELIYPKLFRRCVDYLKAVNDGFRGNLKDWLLTNDSTPSRSENDTVVVGSKMEVKLSELIQQRNSSISFQADLLDLVFVEK